jgi:hypothetical protein
MKAQGSAVPKERRRVGNRLTWGMEVLRAIRKNVCLWKVNTGSQNHA